MRGSDMHRPALQFRCDKVGDLKLQASFQKFDTPEKKWYPKRNDLVS